MAQPTPTLLDSALNFIISKQYTQNLGQIHYKGEWPNYMHLKGSFVLIGNPQKALDANAFTLASIHNFLAEIYLLDTTQKVLLPSIQAAGLAIEKYSEGNSFNFWLPFDKTIKHSFFNPKKMDTIRVHKANNFRLNNKLIRRMSNIPNDADDTNMANLSRYYQNKIFNKNLPLADTSIFSAWIDDRRQNRNWYNVLGHTKKNSGAYLTWLSPEKKLGVWTPLHSLVGLMTIFFPFSSAYPQANEPWVPFGANDVDPIVNANILNYLAKTDQYHDSSTNRQAIKMITQMAQKGKWQIAGIYYPNIYHLHYSIAKAHNAGIAGLHEASSLAYKHIENSIQANGSFESPPWLNDGDKIQSTAYALHALLSMKTAGIKVDQTLIDRSMAYLLSQKQTDGPYFYWKGGVFFTGGTALRNILQWYADCYTTALIADILAKYNFQKSN